MKTTKILYLFMAVWMLLATTASAAVAVCQAPCCMPKASSQAKAGSGDCCHDAPSTEAEAAAFFAGETAPLASLANDEGGCHVAKADNCVMELNRGGEAVTHALTLPLEAPGEALLPAPSYVFPPETAAGLRQAFAGSRSLSPPGQHIYLSISSFLC